MVSEFLERSRLTEVNRSGVEMRFSLSSFIESNVRFLRLLIKTTPSEAAGE